MAWTHAFSLDGLLGKTIRESPRVLSAFLSIGVGEARCSPAFHERKRWLLFPSYGYSPPFQTGVWRPAREANRPSPFGVLNALTIARFLFFYFSRRGLRAISATPAQRPPEGPIRTWQGGFILQGEEPPSWAILRGLPRASHRLFHLPGDKGMPAGVPRDIDKRAPASGSLFGGVLVFQAQGADPPREAPVRTPYNIYSIYRL